MIEKLVLSNFAKTIFLCFISFLFPFLFLISRVGYLLPHSDKGGFSMPLKVGLHFPFSFSFFFITSSLMLKPWNIIRPGSQPIKPATAKPN